MIWIDDLTGAEPIIRDVLLYDATSIEAGEMVMLGNTTPDSNGDHGVAFQTAYDTSTGQDIACVDALGVCQETIACTVLPDVATDAGSYGKVVINPFAIYLCEYSQAAANDIALTSAWSTTTLTLTDLEDNIDCGWILAASESATTSFKGQLRFISASAAGSCTVGAPSIAGAATTDMIIKIYPVNHRLTMITADAQKLAPAAAVGTNVSLGIIENYVMADSISLAPLRRAIHDNLDLVNPRIFAKIIMLDHVYNPNA